MSNREQFWTPKNRSQQAIKNNIDEALSNYKNQETSKEENPEPFTLLETKELVEQNPELEDLIYDWYANAMTRKDREALDKERFVYHFFEGGSTQPTVSFGNKEKGFLLGFIKNGIFVPTHFAPKTLKGGYELIKDLGGSKILPSVMAVTPDLTDTISKIPTWHALDLGFLSTFRNKVTEKNIVYNDHTEVQNLMSGLLSEYLDESDNNFDEDFRNDERDEESESRD